MLGSTEGISGHCQSDTVPEVSILPAQGDSSNDYMLTSANYSSLSSQKVTVAGISGTKMSGNYIRTEEAGLGPDNGTLTVEYVFVANNQTYVAEYQDASSQADLNTFNQIVQTLEFHS